MEKISIFNEARTLFHAALLKKILNLNSDGVASNADKANGVSKAIALRIAEKLKAEVYLEKVAGQTSGNEFESICSAFLQSTFLELGHLRPGSWNVTHIKGRQRLKIAEYEQYAHLIALDNAAKNDRELAAALGSDYTISPDVIITRKPESDDFINDARFLVDEKTSTLTSIRAKHNPLDILHASISCKWTIRSDRAQNARSEALNLIRNRKGKLPHISVVKAEPTPSRLASIALGTGDIDCVYHFALYELQEAVKELKYHDAEDLLSIMVEGKRLKDISDLPLDLAI